MDDAKKLTDWARGQFLEFGMSCLETPSFKYLKSFCTGKFSRLIVLKSKFRENYS